MKLSFWGAARVVTGSCHRLTACGKNIPQTNKNTAQNVYNRGVQLLRAECKAKNLNFANQIAGYNKEVQGYFGNRIKLKLITA